MTSLASQDGNAKRQQNSALTVSHSEDNEDMSAYDSKKGIPTWWIVLWIANGAVGVGLHFFGKDFANSYSCLGNGTNFTTQAVAFPSSSGVPSGLPNDLPNNLLDCGWQYYLGKLLEGGGLSQCLHILIMPIFMCCKADANARESRRERGASEIDPSGKTVLFSMKLTCCEWLFYASLGQLIKLINFAIDLIKHVGIDLSIFWFPMPFYKFAKNRTLISSIRIKGARVRFDAVFSDAYFNWYYGRFLNFLTLSLFDKFGCGKYGKWLDKKLIWYGSPPPGFNNEFKVFTVSLSFCEKIQKALLMALFGWIPFFNVCVLQWSYEHELKHYILGGQTPHFDRGFTFESFFGAYCASFCGLCMGAINKFCDSHIEIGLADGVAMTAQKPESRQYMPQAPINTTAVQVQIVVEPSVDLEAHSNKSHETRLSVEVQPELPSFKPAAFCSACGTKSNGGKFCGSCGNSLA